MKTVFISLLLVISFTNCSCSNLKIHPEYTGVDPKVQNLVNEYKQLARERGIVFTNKVSIGFKKLSYGNSSNLTKKLTSKEDDNIIGICNYGLGWREIDLSIQYWSKASSVSQKTLLFHELTHCYCGRDHDFQGKPYPETYKEREADLEKMISTRKALPGYYDDFCPKSIMFPEILEDYCSWYHHKDYEKEMFENCEEW